MASADRFLVGESIPSLEALSAKVSAPGHGAVVGFLGIVRETSGDRRVAGLNYEAYPEMAVAKMREISDELRLRFGSLRIAAAHRTGRLGIGEISFALAVGAAHRREAFEAAALFVDRLKEIVPIWKSDLTFEEGE